MSEPSAGDLIDARLGEDGVLVATIDMPARTMNVFSAALMDALDALMDRVDADAGVRSVVLTSGKPSFLAGADLSMVRGYCDMAERLDAPRMFEVCGRLGRQLLRLEASDKPWVAAVNGLALGGGLELAMACRERLVADDEKLQLGLPEVKLGLLPGAGGTQRLPRLIGFAPALDLLLSGRSIGPAQAVRAGLFRRALPAARLLHEARALALSLQGQAFLPGLKFAHLAQQDVPSPSDQDARSLARSQGIGDADFDHYPAYGAIADAVLLGARQPMAEATATEMHQFLRLMFSPVAGNMIRTLFLNRQRAEREAAPADGWRIERVSAGPLTADRKPWADALAKARITWQPDASLPENTLALHDQAGRVHHVGVAMLPSTSGGETGDAGGRARALLSAPGPFGRVLEIVDASEAEAQALAALGAQLRALPLRSHVPGSALSWLATLDTEDADAQALAVLDRASEASRIDSDLYDVGACVAGLAPAWSGGPFTHLWRERERLGLRFSARQAAHWARLEPLLRKARA